MSLTLEQGDTRRITPDDCAGGDIESGGMGPCFGVFVYDPESKVTFAGHFGPGTCVHCPEDLTGMLNQAFDEFRSSQEVRVYVSGCCQSNDPAEADFGWQESRHFVERQFQCRNTPNVRLELHWPAAGVQEVTMILEPDSGHFEIL